MARYGILMIAVVGLAVVTGDAMAEQWGAADQSQKWQQHCEHELAKRIPPQIAGKVENVRVDWNLVEAARKDGTGHLKGEGLMKLNGKNAGFLFQCDADVHSAKVKEVHFRMK